MVMALWFPPVGTFGIILAVGGTILAIVEFKGVLRVALVVACVLLGAGEVVSIVKNESEHTREVNEQKQAVENLKNMIQTSEIRNAGDMGYLKGRLEAALSRPMPQFDTKGFAAALSEGIKTEIGNMSDKQLADATLAFCQELNVFSANHRAALYERMSQEETEDRAVGSAPMDQEGIEKQRKIWDKYRQLDMQDRMNWEYEYRTKYMARAVYFRDMLWSRMGIQEQQLKGLDSSAQIAFRGILAGADPVQEAATYLETLAHQLADKHRKD